MVNGTPDGAHGLLGRELRAAVDLGRRRRVALGQGMIGGRPALRADRGNEDEVPDMRLRRGRCQPRRRQPIDAIVCRGVGAAGYGRCRRDARLDRCLAAAAASRTLRAKSGCCTTSTPPGNDSMRPPHCRAHRVAVARQGRDYGAADETGRAGDQDAAHVRPRPKVTSSQATRIAPAVSAAISLGRPGTITETTASDAEADVHDEHARDHGHGRKARCRWRADRNACGAPARTARAAHQAPQQGDRGVGEIIERHHDARRPDGRRRRPAAAASRG